MDTSTHNMNTLFAQLGLENDPTHVKQWISSHSPLNSAVSLAEAPFWNEAQREFIMQAWEEDSDWCEAIDELDALLRH
ncbi:DUF2789 domain-containing protein [Hahella sp. CR1]|uniref:DUF2789 domain-containing protein n=1 Tax=unclassified Hahella TaxID=2624107 RepID=UPI002442CFEC|nr:DUF2789 domain-containing protein [Hahella sp. CR1]MDG9666203.1 DUF2789 domain-containing protein [Hahella sp. CR1]